jgi:hypothetical protein
MEALTYPQMLIPKEAFWQLHLLGLVLAVIVARRCRRCTWVFPVWFVVALTSGMQVILSVVILIRTVMLPTERILPSGGRLDETFAALPYLVLFVFCIRLRPKPFWPSSRTWGCAVASVFVYHGLIFATPFLCSREVEVQIQNSHGQPICNARCDYGGLYIAGGGSATSDSTGRARIKLLWGDKSEMHVEHDLFRSPTIWIRPRILGCGWRVEHKWFAPGYGQRDQSKDVSIYETVSYVRPIIHVTLKDRDPQR